MKFRPNPRRRQSGSARSGFTLLEMVIVLGIIAERASGHPGRPGLVGSRTDGTAWSPRFVRRSAEVSATTASFELIDPVAELGLSLLLEVGEVLTIPLNSQLFVLRIRNLPSRRGPPAEARTHYVRLDVDGSEMAQ